MSVFCMNVTGQFIMLLFTLSRRTINQSLVLNAPADAVAAADG